MRPSLQPILNLFLLLSGLTLAVPAFSGTPIDLSCPQSRSLRHPDSGETAMNYHLELLKDRFSSHPSIVRLANQMIKEPKSSQTYAAHAQTLAILISGSRKESSAPARSKFPSLDNAVRSLLKKYPDRASRAAAPRDYLSDLEQVLALTESGNRVLRCFKAPANPERFREGYQYLSPEEANRVYGYGGAGTLSYVGMKDRTGMRTKSIIYDLDSSPLVSLFLLAHEMQHGCDADAAALSAEQWRRARKEGNGTSEAKRDAKRDYDESALILEARGYLAAQKTFEEYAKKVPALVCNEAYVSSFFEGEVITLADYYGYIQSTIQSGEFSRWQGLDYSKTGLYHFESILEHTGNPQEPALKAGIRARLIGAVQKAEQEFSK